MTQPTFNAPGPGQWALDRSHLPGGSTPIVQELMSRSMSQGMRRVFAEIGAPLDTLDVRFINGWMYTRLRPLISPDKPAKRLPPLPLVKLVSRLHPEFRRRARTAAIVLDQRPWRTVIHEWEHGGRAVVEQANLELQDVNLSALTDIAVANHVRCCPHHSSATRSKAAASPGIGTSSRQVPSWAFAPLPCPKTSVALAPIL